MIVTPKMNTVLNKISFPKNPLMVQKPQRKQNKHKDKITREIRLIFFFLLQIKTLGLSSHHLTLHAKNLRKLFTKTCNFPRILKYFNTELTFMRMLNISSFVFLILKLFITTRNEVNIFLEETLKFITKRNTLQPCPYVGQRR